MKITTKNLQLSYGAAKILKGISLYARPGNLSDSSAPTAAENPRCLNAFTVF